MNDVVHSADVKASREASIYRGTSFAVQEIQIAAGVLNASIKTLNASHDAEKMVDVKLAAENIAKVASQINALAHSLATTFQTHINRRPRV